MDQDYLTCGLCLKEFPLQQITLFIHHKKLDCEEDSATHFEETDLKCYYCPRGFMTAWGLLVHVQLTHSMRIFVEKTSLSITTQPNQNYCGTQHISTPQLKVSPKGIIDESKSLTLQNRQIVLNNNPNSEITQSVNVSGNTDLSQAPENLDTSNDLDRNRILSLNNATDFVENNIPNKAFDCQSLPKDSIKLYSHVGVSKPGQSIDNQVAHHYTKTAQQTESLSTVYTPLSKHLTHKSPYEVVHKSNNDIYPMAKDVRAVPGEIVQRSPPPLDKTSNEANLACVDSKQIDTELNLQGESGAKQISETNDEQLHERGNDREQGYENRVDDENDDMNDCCDNQGCGITVIPGSHQDLQECCNAVVPKKRKRHMELKHMPFSYSSSRYARRRMLQRSLTLASKSSTVTHSDPPASGTNTIFIDVEPDTFTENSKAINSDNHTASSTDSGPETKDSKSVSMTMLPPPDPDSKTKSLILQPGAIFSIPFSYSLPNSASRTSSSIPISIVQAHLSGKQTISNSVTSKTLVPVSSEAIGQGHNQESMSQTDDADISPGELIIADSDGRRRKYPTSKPFKCDRCPMAFNQRIHLKKHMSKHTGIKPYKCGECDYSTVERSHLKVHIRIHTGEKPFKCTYCEYATAQNSTLKIHLKRHHGGKMFACHDCDKTFTQIEQLQGHQTEHISGNGGLSVIKKKSTGIDIKSGSSEDDRQSPGKEGSSINVGKDNTKTSVENTTDNNEVIDNTNNTVINSNYSPKLVIDTEKETSGKKD